MIFQLEYHIIVISHQFSISDLHSIVVSTSVSHPGDPGSIPRLSKLVHIFIKFFQKNQTLRAKITPCPCPKLENILVSHSHDLKDWFKAKKIMVGHLGGG